MVAQEMAAVAEDDEVVASRRRDLGDHLGRVARAQVDLELDPGMLGLLAHAGRDAGSGPSIASAVRCASATLASSSAFANARSEASEPSTATRIRSNGIYRASAAAARSRRRSASACGWKNRCAIAVGTIAESTTTAISRENWVRSMMSAFRP